MKKFLILIAVLAGVVGLPASAAAQSLTSRVLALYPGQASEVVFVDLRALRASPHYAQLKARLLPERFRQLADFTRAMGIDWDRDVHQLSWASVTAGEGRAVGFVGVAEGTFSLEDVLREARRVKLSVTRHADHPVIVLGHNDQGRDFVFAFPDQVTAVFGFRENVQEMLDRRAQGGSSLLVNKAFVDLIGEVNGRAPLWIALDSQSTTLGLKQMLPEAAHTAALDALAARLQSAALRFELQKDFRGLAALRCLNNSDAQVFAVFAQAVLADQAQRLATTNPDLARVLSGLRVARQDDRIEFVFDIREPDFALLLQRNSLGLKF